MAGNIVTKALRKQLPNKKTASVGDMKRFVVCNCLRNSGYSLAASAFAFLLRLTSFSLMRAALPLRSRK